MKKTYRIEINDFHSDENEARTLKVEVIYPTLDMAAAAGWAIIEALAAVHGLECENQGDQYMAYYTPLHDNAGAGAFTVVIYDNEGRQVDDL